MENIQLCFKLRECKVDPWQGPHVTDQQRWRGGKVQNQGPCYTVAVTTCVPVPCIWSLTTQFQGQFSRHRLSLMCKNGCIKIFTATSFIKTNDETKNSPQTTEPPNVYEMYK